MNFKGTGRTNPVSIAWANGEGALWFNRKFCTGPRFEVNAKVSINSGACKERDWQKTAIDGFTLIVSGSTTDFLGGGGGNIGYSGITDSIVTEIDLWKNDEFKDVEANQMTVRNCGKNEQCTPMESTGTSRWKIPAVRIFN